jgi:hypothetical protein
VVTLEYDIKGYKGYASYCFQSWWRLKANEIRYIKCMNKSYNSGHILKSTFGFQRCKEYLELRGRGS